MADRPRSRCPRCHVSGPRRVVDSDDSSEDGLDSRLCQRCKGKVRRGNRDGPPSDSGDSSGPSSTPSSEDHAHTPRRQAAIHRPWLNNVIASNAPDTPPGRTLLLANCAAGDVNIDYMADAFSQFGQVDTIQVINTPKADTTHAVFIVFVDHSVREWARDAINTPGFPERQAGLNPAPWSQLIRVRKPIKAQCYNGGPQLTQCLKRWNAVRGTNIHYSPEIYRDLSDTESDNESPRDPPGFGRPARPQVRQPGRARPSTNVVRGRSDSPDGRASGSRPRDRNRSSSPSVLSSPSEGVLARRQQRGAIVNYGESSTDDDEMVEDELAEEMDEGTDDDDGPIRSSGRAPATTPDGIPRQPLRMKPNFQIKCHYSDCAGSRRKFATMGLLGDHCIAVHDAVRCDLCPRVTQRAAGMAKHLGAHGEGKKCLYCPICHAMYSNTEKLGPHLYQHGVASPTEEAKKIDKAWRDAQKR